MFEQIVTYVDIGMWCLILFGIIIAFIRGFKKDFNNMMAVITIIVLCYIFSPIVTKAIINLDVSWILKEPGPISLLSKVKELLAESINITVESGSTLDEYLTATAIALLNIPVYLILLFNSFFTVRFLLRLIFKLIPIPKGKSFLGRVGGVCLQLITMTLVLYFGFGLIFGVEGLVQDVVEYSAYIENDSNSAQVSETDETLSKIGEYIKIIDSKPFFKMVAVCSGHNHKLETYLLGDLCKIKTKDATLNLVKEKEAYLPLVPTIMEATKSDDPNNILNIVIKNREIIIKTLKKSKLFEFAMPLLVEVAEQKVEIEDIDFSKLKNINWSNEKEDLLNIIDEVLKILKEANFDFSDYKTIFADENLSNYLKRIGAQIDKSHLIKSVLLPFVDSKLEGTLEDSLPEKLKPLQEILVLSKLNFEKDLEIVGFILNDISNLGILEENSTPDYVNGKDYIIDLITQIFNISIISGNEEKILMALIDYIDLEAKLQELSIELNKDQVTDWQNEVEILKRTLSTILDILAEKNLTFEDADMANVFNELIGDSRLETIIKDICSSELLSNSIISLIDKLLQESSLQEFESDYFVRLLNGEEEYNADLISDDLISLINLIKQAKDLDLMNIDFNEVDNDTLDDIQQLVIDINNLNLLKIDKLIDYVNELLSSLDYQTRVLPMYDYNNNGTKDEWNAEIPRLFNIIKEVKSLNFDNDTLVNNSEALGAVLDQMKESYLFGNNTQQDLLSKDDDIFDKFMVESLIKMGMIGTNGFISQAKAEAADWSIYNYTEELAIISQYDFEVEAINQSDETIKALQGSMIIKDFFDLAGIINDKIKDTEIALGPFIVIKLKDHVNGGEPLTQEDLYDTNWADELDAINALIDILNSNDGNTEGFKEGIENMSQEPTDTYAKQAAISIKQHLQETPFEGISIWDLL